MINKIKCQFSFYGIHLIHLIHLIVINKGCQLMVNWEKIQYKKNNYRWSKNNHP